MTGLPEEEEGGNTNYNVLITIGYDYVQFAVS